MKKLLLVTALSLVVSTQVFAEGTEIRNSYINNTADITHSNNTSGKFSEANMGSIKIEKGDLLIKDSYITNDATIQYSNNVSGEYSKANMGSVVIDSFNPYAGEGKEQEGGCTSEC